MRRNVLDCENGLCCDTLMYICIYLFIYLVYPYSNVDHMKLHTCVLYIINIRSLSISDYKNYMTSGSMHVNHMYVK